VDLASELLAAGREVGIQPRSQPAHPRSLARCDLDMNHQVAIDRLNHALTVDCRERLRQQVHMQVGAWTLVHQTTVAFWYAAGMAAPLASNDVWAASAPLLPPESPKPKS